MRTEWSVQKLIYTGTLAAVAGAFVSLEFSAPMISPLYRIDSSDMPPIIVLLFLGPVSVAWVEIIKIITKLITVGTNSMYVGESANLIGIVLSVVPMQTVYKEDRKARRTVIVLLIVSIPIKTLFACFCNTLITLPLYATAMGFPLNQVIIMVAAANLATSDLTIFIFMATIPFNLVKLGLNCFVRYLSYTRLLAVYSAVKTV